VLDCAGGYFITADIRPLETGLSDVAFCETITREAGVAAVPVSAFYEEGEGKAAKPDHFVRFCFCKQPTLLDEALGRLARYFG
jgi:aspartate/methionine/tyrosine aminotransferase